MKPSIYQVVLFDSLIGIGDPYRPKLLPVICDRPQKSLNIYLHYRFPFRSARFISPSIHLSMFPLKHMSVSHFVYV